MPLSRQRDYLSIGEVLESVRTEFPDVSVSKIRFLESEGLITPERTPSGYRKFYDGDVARLRYILQLQRDQFLPLKVIRERLAEVDSDGGAIPEVTPTHVAAAGDGEVAAQAPPVDPSGMQLTRSELQSAAGLSEEQLSGLEDFGLLHADDGYDENDLMVAKAAGRFFGYGVEPRHLRMYKQFADREATFFEQIVVPVKLRRDPKAEQEAARSVRELIGLSRQMREAVLRATLRPLL